MHKNSRNVEINPMIRFFNIIVLTIALVIATFTFPIMIPMSANPLPNNPPNTPNTPIPMNNTTGISITSKLNWTGGDPDGNPVKYDVYFGKTSSPPIVVHNQSFLGYNPGTLNYSTHYYWKIIAWDNFNLSAKGPLWSFTTEPKPNFPPNTPSNPSPANSATKIYLSTTLGWTGGDPDGNPVKYDIYFGLTNPPPKVISNQSALTYDPTGTLTPNTKYYWKIVAWDNYSASTQGPIWSFTTKTLPTVSISKPLANTLYFQDDVLLGQFSFTVVYGPITITADASSEIDIQKVEFFCDGKLIGVDLTKPYECYWNITDLRDELNITHTIKVVAYDKEGDHVEDELTDVIMWRFHPLPFYIAGGAIVGLSLLKLIPHTTVRGLFFDVQQSMFTTSFYALRIHYSTQGPFRHSRGVINFKSCSGGILIGPIKMTRFGPLHNVVYGSFSFLGDIHYNIGDFGTGNNIQLPATTFADIFQYLRT